MKNNTFSINRFGAFFLYEIKKAWSSCGWSLLIICLLPLIAFLGFEVFASLTRLHWVDGNSAISYISLFAAICVAVMIFPSKIYGEITDKKAGSNYLMIPASTLEKFLSMVLVTCLVLPAAFTVGFFTVEAFVSLIPGYGQPIILSATKAMEEVSYFFTESVDLSINPYLSLYAEWCSTILCFTLGAIFFEKSKTAKTILAMMILGFVLSSVAVSLLQVIDFTGDAFQDFCASFDIEKLHLYFNIVVIGFNLVGFAVLFTAIYYRLRTLKH